VALAAPEENNKRILMHVFLISAISADGYIAEEAEQVSTEWTSKEDKQFFRDRTKKARVMVMGMNTYKTIGRPLPDRLTVVMTRTPQEVPAEQKDQLMFTSQTPQEVLADLEKKGFTEVAICGGSQIYTLFLNAGLINTLYLTVEPVVFGKGVHLFADTVTKKLKLENTTQLNSETLLLEYSVHNI